MADLEKIDSRKDPVHVSEAAVGEAVAFADRPGVDWTPEEEKRAVWKQTMLVMPLLILGFFALQLDRGNISQALTGTLYKDVHVSQDQVNTGQSLLLVMIVLFEIPSNLILIRVGAKWWLSGQMIIWGLIATCQCKISTPAGFFVTRVLLGIAESGFIPGSVYLISSMFTHRETSFRIAWFYLGNIIGKGSAGLLGAVLLPYQGKSIMPGWALIFLVEGIISIFVGLLNLCFLPVSSMECRTLLGFRLFTERESHILTSRVILDDPLKEAPRHHFTKKNIVMALGQWRIWFHVLFCICDTPAANAVALYNAAVVKSLGFPTGKANALSSIGSWGQAPCSLICGFLLSRSRFKGPIMITVVVIILILSSVYLGFDKGSIHTNKWGQFAVLQLISSFSEAAFTGGLTWAVSTARTPTQRSMFSALYVMASNAGQAIGGQMFRANDSPKYIRGFTGALGLRIVDVLVGIFLTIQYVYSNKHNWGEAGQEAVGLVHGEEPGAAAIEGDVTVRRVFKYPT